MNPAEYTTVVVLPAVAEFLAVPGEVCIAYTLCVLTSHIVDYIAAAKRINKKPVCERVDAD